MISNLLDVLGYGALTYGAYVFGGRGAAGFVAGFCLLLLSFSVAKRQGSAADTPRFRALRDADGGWKFVRVRPEQKPRVVRVPDSVITNADLDRELQEMATGSRE